MSLKAYLQSLINVLLKKSVENTSPSPSLYSEVNVTTSGDRILSPVDGWVRVQAKCNGLQVDSYSCIAIVNNQDQQWPSIVLPVKKGSNLVYNVLDGLIGEVEIWFIHNQTNE